MTLTPFRELITYIGMSLTLFTVLSVASLLVFSRKRPGWQRLRAVDLAYPLVPAAYILVGTCMIVYGLASQPMASLAALGTVGIGGLVHRFCMRARLGKEA